jgi:hypothetical protein
MEKGYISGLSKAALAYNLVYHLKDAKTEQEISEIISHILNSFEYKEDKE